MEKKRKTCIFALFMIAAMLLCLVISPVGATIIDVYPGNDLESILETGTSAGDVVLLFNGTHNISSYTDIMYDGISLRGEDVLTTFIYSSSGKIRIKASNALIENITFQNDGDGSSAITANSGYPGLEIKNCIFEDLLNSDVISLRDFTQIEGNTFVNCTGLKGIKFRGSDVTFTKNKFVNCEGAALYLYADLSKHCVITHNDIDVKGTFLYFYKTTVDDLNMTIYMNNIVNITTFAESSDISTYVIPSQTHWTSPSMTYTYNGNEYTHELGNYWSGYTGTDGNGDGIGDTPYTIPDGLGTDAAPLIKPVENYAIVHYEPPAAGFTYSMSSGRVPLTVTFTDASAGDLTEWSWNFGDGETSAEQNPVHTYLTEGTYSVTLEVSGPGGTDSYTKSNAVSVSKPLTSDSYNGGIPLTTAKDGIVSGDLWYESYPGMEKSVEKNFTLPAYTDIEWARLYITVYCGNQVDNYRGSITIDIDGDGDEIFEIHENETFNTSYSFPGTGGTGPVWLSDHMNRVASDYMMWYDLTGAITSGGVDVHAATQKIDSDFDGSIKAMTLVVAYNDGDFDEVYYWVNQGHDTINPMDQSYLGYTGETTFDTSTFTGSWSSANLSAIYLASSDGEYIFKSTPLTSGTPTGNYYGEDDWDVTSIFFAGQDSVLEYSSNANYKIPLALLSARYDSSSAGAPVANFSADITAGDAPLTVSFTDESTGATGWSWNFGDGDSTNSTEQNPVHTYSSAGTYTVILTATNSKGIDSETKTGYITVSSGSSGDAPPVAGFIANITSGMVPMTVQFTDSSSNSPNSWMWDFGDGNTSTIKNPVHTFVSIGTYSVNLTVSNSYGNDSEVKTDYITVNEYSEIDLTITNSVNPVPAGAVFARENNTVRVLYVKNSGTGTATNIKVSLYASDVSNGAVPVDTQTIDSLEGGGSIIYTGLTDPTIRDLEGSTVAYTVSLDPENAIMEIDETNNNKTSPDNPVKYNGYKGKGIYWEGGSNITTKHTYDLKGDMVYSTQYRTSYTSVFWTDRTETWSAADLPIPTGATVVDVWLYVSYNWDQTPGGYPDWTGSFNGNTIDAASTIIPYTDRSNFGAYAGYDYGLYPINVTDYFNPEGNTFTMTKNGEGKVALYPSTLVAIYSDPSATRKQIFINEECDELAVSSSLYATTVEEATAYVPFSGMKINVSEVDGATLYSFAGSAGPDEGNLLFNGNTVAMSAWPGDLCSSIPYVADVTAYLRAEGNEAAVQGTVSGGMCAYEQILVVEYNAAPQAPKAAFTASPLSGTEPLKVRFIDKSANTPTSWEWDFDNDSITDSTDKNPVYTYSSAGNYSVKLTVANAIGQNSTIKTDYIKVQKKLIVPDVNFTAAPVTGKVPFEVQFNDTSLNSPISWLWQFGDGANSTSRNPLHTYTMPGTYSVNLTASNVNGTASYMHTNLITAVLPNIPSADFKADITMGIAPLNVQFTDLSTNSPTEWFWNFGDYSNSTEQNPLHTYTANGTYTVSLTASNEDGNSTKTRQEYIEVPKTSALSNYNNIHIRPANDEGISFDIYSDGTYYIGASPKDTGLGALGFSDSPFSGSGEVIATSDISGEFYIINTSERICYDDIVIMLAVNSTIPSDFEVDIRTSGYNWTPFGEMDWQPLFENITYRQNIVDQTFTKDDLIYGPQNWKPTAGNENYPVFAGEDMTIPQNSFRLMFIDTHAGIPGFDNITDNGAVKVEYTFRNLTGHAAFNAYGWNMNTSEGKELLWTNDLSGSNPSGYVVTGSADIPESALIVDFASDINQGEMPLTVSFTDATPDNPVSWFWQFGDGQTSSEQNPLHTYTMPGTYSVNLTASNATLTNSTLKVNFINVKPPSMPVANFTSARTSGTVPLSVKFTDTSTGNATAWEWDFDSDGITDSTEQNPLNVYSNPGVYSVSLKVQNLHGTDNITKTDYITANEKKSSEPSYSSSGSDHDVVTSRGRLDYKDSDKTGEIKTSEEGKVLADVSVPSKDGFASLEITKNTIALDKSGGVIDKLAIEQIDEGSVPEIKDSGVFEIMGNVYKCTPAGATFSPYIEIKFKIKTLDELRKLNGKLPVVRYYNTKTKEWEEIETTFDENTMTVTAKITHFSAYALFAKLVENTTVMLTEEPTEDIASITKPVIPESNDEETSPASAAILGMFSVGFAGICGFGAYRFKKSKLEEDVFDNK